MKKLLLLMLLTALPALAQTNWTLSFGGYTNLVSPAYVYYGTNGTDSGADTTLAWVQKNNGNSALLARTQTNPPVFTATNLPASSNAVISLMGVTNGVAYYLAGIPAGPAGASGTNFVTTQVFTNVMYSTFATTLTNISVINFTGSNFIGSFPQIYQYALTLPQINGVAPAPPTTPNETVILSTNSGASWFTNTTGTVTIWTNVQMAIIGDNSTTNAGSLLVQGLNLPQYYGIVNSLVGQELLVNTAANASDPVPLGQLQTLLANATASSWQSATDTNGFPHLQYLAGGSLIMDLNGHSIWSKINSFYLSGTNFILTVTATNLYAGSILQMSTNLALLGGWNIYTNFTVTTNSGVASFSIPRTASYAFFRVVSPQTPAVISYAPFTANFCVISPSNSWTVNYATITNVLQPGGIANFVNSNGAGQYRIQNSNGVFLVLPQ